jgi:hypothetical protein
MKTTVLLAFILLNVVNPSVSGGDEQPPFELTTLLGETFQHCRILKATPEGITVSHDNGVSKIPFDNLNDEWKKKFHYSPEKARAFQKEEAARRAMAEEKERQLRREYEKNQQKLLGEQSAAESLRLRKIEEAVDQQQVGVAAAAAASQPGLPGAGAVQSRISSSGGSSTTVQSTTEVIIPPTTPIGQVFTPGVNGSPRFIINQGTFFTTGDGIIHSVFPGWVNPGFISPGFTNPPIICPPGTARPGVPVRPLPAVTTPGATIRVGPGAIRVGR